MESEALKMQGGVEAAVGELLGFGSRWRGGTGLVLRDRRGRRRVRRAAAKGFVHLVSAIAEEDDQEADQHVELTLLIRSEAHGYSPSPAPEGAGAAAGAFAGAWLPLAWGRRLAAAAALLIHVET